MHTTLLRSRTGLCSLLVATLAYLGSLSVSSAGSIGLNFSVEGNADTELTPDETAGKQDVSQQNWNNLSGARNGKSDLVDDSGKEIPALSAEWNVSADDQLWRSKAGADWGFKGNDLKLQKGFIQLGGTLTVTGIPYAKYDVYVYLNAGPNGGTGKVSISSGSGKVDQNGTYFYKLDWLRGKFVPSQSTSSDKPDTANMVIFSGNTAKEIVLEWNGNLGGGWSGASAVQIVETH